MYLAIQSQPPGSVQGALRITEQVRFRVPYSQPPAASMSFHELACSSVAISWLLREHCCDTGIPSVAIVIKDIAEPTLKRQT